MRLLAAALTTIGFGLFAAGFYQLLGFPATLMLLGVEIVILGLLGVDVTPKETPRGQSSS